MKKIEDKIKESYLKLLNCGMFWEFHPEASGVFSEDLEWFIYVYIQSLTKENEELKARVKELEGYLDKVNNTHLDNEAMSIMREYLNP